MIKKSIVINACGIVRNLDSKKFNNKIIKYLIIRSRFLIKNWITKNHKLLNNIEKETTLRYAGKLQLNLNEFIDRSLFIDGTFDHCIVKEIREILEPGDTFIDIGANCGYMTLIGAQCVGPEGEVFAFEASTEMFKKLTKNISLNQLNNIHCKNEAISDKEGIVHINIPVSNIKNSGRASMRIIEEAYQTQAVNAIPIDNLLPALKRVKLIKIDIEGAEGLALEGMKKLLNRDYPYLIIELSDEFLKQLGYNAERILEFLRSYNYKVINLENREEITQTAEKDYQLNVLCIPNKL